MFCPELLKVYLFVDVVVICFKPLHLKAVTKMFLPCNVVSCETAEPISAFLCYWKYWFL